MAVCLSNSSRNASGFETEKQANKYINRHICQWCRDDLAKHLKAKRNNVTNENNYLDRVMSLFDLSNLTKEQVDDIFFDYVEEYHILYGDNFPSCIAEWAVMKTSDYVECKDFGDIVDKIWTRIK